jgi:Scramblase
VKEPQSFGYGVDYSVVATELTSGLQIRRPFAWINSRMYVQKLKDWNEYSTTGELVLDTFAEAQQRWHLWRRRYDLFLRWGVYKARFRISRTEAVDRATPKLILSKAGEDQPEPEPDHFAQFAKIDEGFFAWHFTLRGSRGEELASISRAFRGFGREIFTDTGESCFREVKGRGPPSNSKL